MNISLIVVGETKSQEIQSLMDDYAKRILNYTSFDVVVASEEKLLKTLSKFERIILLEEIGKPMTSREFAGFLDNQMSQGANNLAFVIGGPFGFTPEAKALADTNMSLSRMTFPHDLVRVIFLEQLYRGFTILRNEKYHHE